MARTDSEWETTNGGSAIKTIAPAGYDVLINGLNKYLNFNTVIGSTGYGFRDNNGIIQFKNSSGVWDSIAGSSDLANYLLRDQTVPQTLSGGAFSGSGLLKITSGLLGVDTSTYLTTAVTSVSKGNGMNFTSFTTTGTITLGTPSTCTASTTNALTSTSHTHAITGFLTAETDTWATVMARGNQSDTEGIIDITSTKALLVRKNSDGGDVFTVDTTNSKIIVGGATHQIGFTGEEDLIVLTSGLITAKANAVIALSGTGYVDSPKYKVGGTDPVADGTYIVGIGGTTNGTITIKGGIITAVQEAVA